MIDIIDLNMRDFCLVEMEPGGGMREVKRIKAKSKEDAVLIFKSIFPKYRLNDGGFGEGGMATFSVMEAYKE